MILFFDPLTHIHKYYLLPLFPQLSLVMALKILTNIGAGIASTNVDLLSTRHSGSKFSEIWIKINKFSFKKSFGIRCLLIVGHFIQASLQWRHNGHDSVSNHQPHDCLINRLFRRRSKNPSKLRVTGLCAGNSPGTGEFTKQMASNTENVSIWWRHHGFCGGAIILWRLSYHFGGASMR